MNKQEIEKAIKLFKDRIDIFERMLEFLDDGFEINECKEEISALNTAISALQQQLTGGWIPVSLGRLPEEKISPITNDYYEYECTFTSDRVTEVRFYKFGGGHWWHGGGCMDRYITAWRERLEPWKDEAYPNTHN